ncbi:MAG: hypothetical protein HKL81_03235, partial [Acidimicrobiaceae bacterium]|nr:hypothetical protein [Acidimicrobiaceae bacterium]
AFGEVGFFGSLSGINLAAPIIGVSPSVSRHGYLLVARDGGVFTFGDARFFGSLVHRANCSNFTGVLEAKDGSGYWIASDHGGVYAMGNTCFLGSAVRIDYPAKCIGIA